MSDTPQTDEAQFGTGRVSVDFARQLERELAAVTEQRDGLKQAVDCANDLLASVTEHRDRLAEALKKIQRLGLVAVDIYDEINLIDEIVDEALQSLTTNTPTSEKI